MKYPFEAAVIARRVQAVVLSATMVVVACSSPDAPPTASTDPKTAEESQVETTTFEVDPSFRQASGKLLPGVPQFPSYPGASLLGSAERNSPNDIKRGHVIEWSTTDSVPSVMAWYQRTLEESGWMYAAPTDGVDHSQLAGISRSAFSGTLEAEAENGITRITVVLEPKQ